MKVTTILRTPKAAAQAMAASARTVYAKPLYPFPYNRFAWHDPPLDRVWWIGPERRNPAYWLGKIVFRSNKIGDADLFIGFYAEKGIDPQTCKYEPANRRERYWLMDDRWVWNAFFPVFAAGDFDQHLYKAERASSVPPTVIVYAGRPFEQDLAGGYLGFEWTEGRLHPLTSIRNGGTAGLLNHALAAASLSDLATRILEIPDLPCVWVDVQIGFRFWLNVSAAEAVQWNKPEIWRYAISPWSVWLR